MSEPSTYKVKQRVRLTAVFRNDMTPVDPTTVTFKLKDPSGAVTTPTTTHDTTGLYHTDVDLASAGTWYYRVEGVGAAVGADEHAIVVEPSQFY